MMKEKIITEEEAYIYLGISKNFMFKYESENDSFIIFTASEEGLKYLYKGTLSEWQKSAVTQSNDVNNSNLDAFCDRLRNGIESFAYRFVNSDYIWNVYSEIKTNDDNSFIVYGNVKQESAKTSDEIRVNRLSDKDPMLDMLNKRAIIDYVKRLFETKDCPITYLVMFDLDCFKMVNDVYGHMTGDKVLVRVAEIINKAVGANGIVGRVGGDEIMIVTRNVSDKESLRLILKEIRMNIEHEFAGKFGNLSLTCSMGAAAYPVHGDSYSFVMQLADKMLYLAKEKGRNRYIIYTPEMHSQYLTSSHNVGNMSKISAISFDKIGIIQYMLDNYLAKGKSNNDEAFSIVGSNFGLSEILIVYDNGKVGFKWTPEKCGYTRDDLKWLKIDEEFLSGFDNNNHFIIDWLSDEYEKRYPVLFGKLKDRDIQSALFYKLTDKDKVKGFIMYARKVQRQKWSEYELLALTTIGKIFNISIYNHIKKYDI